MRKLPHPGAGSRGSHRHRGGAPGPVLDGLGDRLANLPISPVTDLLSGALHLLRRTLLPNVPVIPKFSVTNASVLEGDTGTTDAVFTVQPRTVLQHPGHRRVRHRRPRRDAGWRRLGDGG